MIGFRRVNLRFFALLCAFVIGLWSLMLIIDNAQLPFEITGTGGWIQNGYVLRSLNIPGKLKTLNLPGKQIKIGRQGSKIPKIIHQVWKDEILPTALVNDVMGLVNNHPDWQYYFWTDEAGMKLIEDKYSFLLDVYKAGHVPKHAGLFRSDILRYVVLHEYGGVYFDLDTVSLHPLNDFIQTTDCAFVVEPAEHYFFFNVDTIISNAAMLCMPQHPFLKQILYHIMTMKESCISPMHCSGPLLVTDIYKELNRSGNTLAKLPDVYSSEIFMDVYDHPIQGARLERICRNMTSLKQYQKDICVNWIARGKDRRPVSEKALTYHRWYHLKYHKVMYSSENNITQLAPRTKIYGERNFMRSKYL